MNKLKNNLMLKRILITVFYLILFKIGTYTLLPVIDREAILKMNPTTLSNVAMLSGASLDSFSILTLGISPYILSSMAVQILSMGILPTFKKWKKEGRDGRNKLERVTKGMAIAMAFIQGCALIYGKNKQFELLSNDSWIVIGILAAIMTVGTMIAIWIAGQISSEGIGHGSSVLILLNICEGMVKSMFTGVSYAQLVDADGWKMQVMLYGTFWIALLMITIMVELLQKPYKVRYNIGSSKEQISYYHIKLNNAGIMPLLFASILMAFIGGLDFEIPQLIVYGLAFILVVILTYVYTKQSLNPKETAEDFQRNHVYFDGISSKKGTEEFLQKKTLLITGINAVVLLIYMVLPTIVNTLTKMEIGTFVQIGGTTFLVFVSIVIQLFDSLLSTRHETKIETII